MRRFIPSMNLLFTAATMLFADSSENSMSPSRSKAAVSAGKARITSAPASAQP